VASSWILFFSYQDDARSNTYQTTRFNKKEPFLRPLSIFSVIHVYYEV